MAFESKPKHGILGVLQFIFLLFLFIFFTLTLLFGIFTINLEFIIMSSFGVFSFGYLILINPYMQNSNNYYIEFKAEKPLDGLKVIYKNREVIIKYKIDKKGKIAFADNYNKLGCISYADNSKISNFTKYKIMNYFAKWLYDNKLISEEITSSFESL